MQRASSGWKSGRSAKIGWLRTEMLCATPLRTISSISRPRAALGLNAKDNFRPRPALKFRETEFGEAHFYTTGLRNALFYTTRF